MKVQEVISRVNNGDFNCIFDAEEDLPREVEEVANNLNIDEHRWYIITTSVYKCEDGFVGITGPSSLKSESMTWSDTDEWCTAEEYEAVPSIIYKPKS